MGREERYKKYKLTCPICEMGKYENQLVCTSCSDAFNIDNIRDLIDYQMKLIVENVDKELMEGKKNGS